MAGEDGAAERHEYLDGQVRAMAGESKTHNRIGLNAWQAVVSRLQGGPCAAYASGLRVHIAAANRYYYPDVVVTCDPRDLAPDAPTNYVNHPSIVVEVLSNSTESIDRGEKLHHYKQLPTLQTYLLVDQHWRHVETYRRGEGRLWLYESFEGGETFLLACVGVEIAVDALYAGTEVGTEPLPPTAPH